MRKAITLIAIAVVLSIGSTVGATAGGHNDETWGLGASFGMQIAGFPVLVEELVSEGELVNGQWQVMDVAQASTSFASLQRGNPSLVQAGEALQRFRTLYYVGWGLQLTGALLWVAGGGALSLLGGVVAAAGSVMQFIAFWQVGAAGELLIQAGR